MKGFFSVAIVLFLGGLAFGGLSLHNRSLRLTQRVTSEDSRYRFLSEKRDSLEAEVLRLSSFVRLESLWIAAGRPTYSPAELVAGAAEAGPFLLAAGAGR